jgi:hypothetical protein
LAALLRNFLAAGDASKDDDGRPAVAFRFGLFEAEKRNETLISPSETKRFAPHAASH